MQPPRSNTPGRRLPVGHRVRAPRRAFRYLQKESIPMVAKAIGRPISVHEFGLMYQSRGSATTRRLGKRFAVGMIIRRHRRRIGGHERLFLVSRPFVAFQGGFPGRDGPRCRHLIQFMTPSTLRSIRLFATVAGQSGHRIQGGLRIRPEIGAMRCCLTRTSVRSWRHGLSESSNSLGGIRPTGPRPVAGRGGRRRGSPSLASQPAARTVATSRSHDLAGAGDSLR